MSTYVTYAKLSARVGNHVRRFYGNCRTLGGWVDVKFWTFAKGGVYKNRTSANKGGRRVKILFILQRNNWIPPYLIYFLLSFDGHLCQAKIRITIFYETQPRIKWSNDPNYLFPCFKWTWKKHFHFENYTLHHTDSQPKICRTTQSITINCFCEKKYYKLAKLFKSQIITYTVSFSHYTG